MKPEDLKQGVIAATELILAIRDAIKDLRQVPSGHLYAQLMGVVSHDLYQKVIRLLVESGQIKIENHLITYIGK